MDLATECSVSVSKSSSVHEDDETDVASSVAYFDDTCNTAVTTTTTSNDDVIAEVGNSGSVSQSDMIVVPDIGFGQPLNSPSKTGKAKGHGLKKWKRIKRNIGGSASRASVDDSPSNAVDDYSRPVKRGLIDNTLNLAKPSHHFSVDVREKSEGSVGSVNLGSKIMENGEYYRQGSSSDSRFAVGGAVFAAGNDSENSEDRSSKSSTAASVPKARHQKVVEKNSVSGKGMGSSSQHSSQKEKSWVGTTKKAKGEKVKAEKENSHSSMESDSRSSNFVFMQEGFSASSNGNGKQSGKVTNYGDGENSGEAQAGEQLFNEDLQTGYNIESVDNDLSEDDLATGSSSWKAKQESSDNHLPSTDSDPLVKSVFTLQSVQEALENELQKFVEIGKENGFTSTEGGIDQTQFENIEQSGSTSSLESEVITLTVKVNTLEEKLDEATSMLKAKESRVLELEATAHLAKSENGESSSKDPEVKEIETEAESMFKKKIEAEVEFMAISSKIKNLKTISTDQTALVEEQMHLVDEQKQMLNKLEEAESKAKTLKKHAEELESYCGEILETEEALTMKNRIFKVTSCFSLQLLLLVIFVWLFILQLSPQPEVVVVPT